MPHAPSLFTFGCMSLGKDLNKINEDVRVARAAMDAGVWFHASPTYNRGFTYMILRMAFDESRRQVPPMIVKIRCGNPRLLRFEVEDALGRMKLERLDVAQLVFTETGGYRTVVEDFTTDGPIAAVCAALRSEEKVAQFCPQVDRESSAGFLPLTKKFDGYVLYLNPLERDVTDEMWTHLQQHSTPLWALRTVAGAVGEPSWIEKKRQESPTDSTLAKAIRLAEIAKQSGHEDWTDFCLHYAASVPNLKTTIGGTGKLEHLNHFLATTKSAKPLPAEVMAAIDVVRRG